MVFTLAPAPLLHDQFLKALDQRMNAAPLGDAERRLIGTQFLEAIVRIITVDDRGEETSLPLQAANLKVTDPAQWAYPQGSMLFETQTDAIPRSHNRDRKYGPTEIRVWPETYNEPFEWSLISGGQPSYETYAFSTDNVDETGPNAEFRVHRCYHLKVDPNKRWPVRVLYKRWSKDQKDDDFFLHCALVPLELLQLVSENGFDQ